MSGAGRRRKNDGRLFAGAKISCARGKNRKFRISTIYLGRGGGEGTQSGLLRQGQFRPGDPGRGGKEVFSSFQQIP